MLVWLLMRARACAEMSCAVAQGIAGFHWDDRRRIALFLDQVYTRISGGRSLRHYLAIIMGKGTRAAMSTKPVMPHAAALCDRTFVQPSDMSVRLCVRRIHRAAKFIFYPPNNTHNTKVERLGQL